MEGGYIQLNQKIGSATLSGSWGEETTSWTSGELYVGEKWKIVTHGTHHYEIHLQRREKDSSTWQEYRKYTSNDDQNYTESGSETEGCYMRLVVSVWNDDAASASKLTVDLTRLPYTHTGTAKITAVNSGTSITAAVKDVFGSTDATKDYALSSWNNYYGYPQQSCFFQDRLVFAANWKNPYSLWMSKTGDYPNFSVEKADGNVTDDSAIKMDIIVRNSYQIRDRKSVV